jgi:hypothetical protein
MVKEIDTLRAALLELAKIADGAMSSNQHLEAPIDSPRNIR